MANFDMNPEGEMRDPKQMLHDMKTEARKTKNTLDQDFTPEEQAQMAAFFGQGPLPTRGAEPGAPGSGVSEDIPRFGSVDAGVYSGAGGYEYQVNDDGSIKILKAPKDRGLGVTLTRGIAYNAIMDELRDSSPKAADAPPATPESDRRSREMVGAVKPDDQTLAGAEMAKQKAKEAETAMAQNTTSGK